MVWKSTCSFKNFWKMHELGLQQRWSNIGLWKLTFKAKYGSLKVLQNLKILLTALLNMNENYFSNWGTFQPQGPISKDWE